MEELEILKKLFQHATIMIDLYLEALTEDILS